MTETKNKKTEIKTQVTTQIKFNRAIQSKPTGNKYNITALNNLKHNSNALLITTYRGRLIADVRDIPYLKKLLNSVSDTDLKNINKMGNALNKAYKQQDKPKDTPTEVKETPTDTPTDTAEAEKIALIVSSVLKAMNKD